MNNTRMYTIDGNDTWTMVCQNSPNNISATCKMNGNFYSSRKIVPSCAMETYSTADPGTTFSTLGESNVEVNDKDASSIPVLVYVISAAVLLIIISTLIVALVISLICKFLLNIFL